MQLRWYQEEAVDSIYHYFANGGKGNPVIGLPTGSGKTTIPNTFIKHAMKTWPNQRFLLMSHVKELLVQAHDNMKVIWPNCPISLYSAGLKLKNAAMPVVFAGIQSAVRNPTLFGTRNIIFVDEVHMVNQDESSMYQNFLATMKLINPSVKFVGLSATLYRMGQGMITDGGLFTDVIYDMTSMEGFNRLITEGYLAPLIPHRTREELDVSSVGISKGDYNLLQLESAVDKKEITHKALSEACRAGQNRKSWLIFSSGISHSDHIAEMLSSFGVECASVHSKQTEEYNASAIKAFKAGALRAISSYSKLTTGFDHAGIDLIIDLRPTISVPLHVQKMGRGTRIAPHKSNCLVLDFAKNVPRLGCINDPAIPRKKGEGSGDIPVKLCEACGAYNHTRVQFCCQCGAEFIFRNKLVAKAGKEELLKGDFPHYETFNTTYALYSKYEKPDKPPMLKVTYHCGLQAFTEFQFPENTHQLHKKKFKDWWKSRHMIDPPMSVDACLQHTSALRVPKRIKVWMNKTYKDKNNRNRTSPEIIGVEW